MNTKITSCFVLVLLLLLSGCMGQQPSPQKEAAPAPELKHQSTATVQVPSITPEYHTPIPSPTIVWTDTPELSTPTASPTKTPKISLFQEILSLPKGTYTLIGGNNDTLSDYAFLLLDDTGEVVKKFQLLKSARAFTTDLRFYAYNNGSTFGNYWFDTADTKEIRHHFANNCDQASWSKDNSRLAMLCGDGVHFFEFQNGDWRETSRVIKPDEIKILPDDLHMLNYPLWMSNGFAYFIDDRGEIANPKNLPSYHPLYVLRQECINDPQKCDLSQSHQTISEDTLGIAAVALSEDDQLLAVAFAAGEKGEIRIYDFQTFEVVNRIPLSTNEQDPNWGQVGSMIWGSQPNQIIISMNYYSGKIYRIPDYRKNEIELLFDCPAVKVYNCSIRSKVIVP